VRVRTIMDLERSRTKGFTRNQFMFFLKDATKPTANVYFHPMAVDRDQKSGRRSKTRKLRTY
jgi:hypothetical protein